MEKEIINLPIIEENFKYKLNEASKNIVVSSKGVSMRIDKQLIPEEYLKIEQGKGFSYYPRDISELIELQIKSIMNNINKQYPFKNYLYPSQENVKSTGLFKTELSKIEEIFYEMDYILFYYNYETAFCDNEKELSICVLDDKVYLFFKTLFLKKHLLYLENYLEKRNTLISKGDFDETTTDYEIQDGGNHWTLGNEDIDSFLLHLDSAIIDSWNKISYKIESFDDVHVLLSLILTIKRESYGSA